LRGSFCRGKLKKKRRGNAKRRRRGKKKESKDLTMSCRSYCCRVRKKKPGITLVIFACRKGGERERRGGFRGQEKREKGDTTLS